MKKKFPYNIKKSLTRILPLGALMAIATHCTKEPQPNPNPNPNHGTNIDTITPTKIHIIDWDWAEIPDTNMIKQYANDSYTKLIVLNLLPSAASLTFTPNAFNRGYNKLEQTCFSLCPNKIIGSGTIFVNEEGGAHIADPQESNIYGMSVYDSLRYASKGFQIARGCPPANSR